MTVPTAAALLDELKALADPAAFPQRHYHGTGEIFGVRMGTLFELARRAKAMSLPEVEALLDHSAYEPRLAAFCILDFRVRGTGVAEGERAACYRLYLERHDAIDSWDMIDRAAPRVVGEHLRERSRQPLFDLAASTDPLRRRTAMTAPLIYTRPPHAEGLTDLLKLAEMLLDDRDPLVSKPVGIALKHAGAVAPDAVGAFLDRLGEKIPAPTRRAARAKLPR